jgi:molybdopterin/thiamine biosynthesis adenylyltransferase
MDFSAEWGRYCRHAGMISLEAQKRIKSSTVVIAGIGGIGGPAALMCAKAGFGHIILCDRDQYELANVVEQLFAAEDTVGEDKTFAAAREIKRHNSDCKVAAIQREITCQTDGDNVIELADYVISGVDNPLPRIWLSRAAWKKKVPFLVPANIGWSVFYDSQIPGGTPYEHRRLSLPGVKIENGQLDLDDDKTLQIVQADWDIWIALIGGFKQEFIVSLLKGGISSYPYMAAPAFFGASFGVSQLIELVAEGHSSYVYPNVFCFDMRTCQPLDWEEIWVYHDRLIDAFVNRGRTGLVDSWIEHGTAGA